MPASLRCPSILRQGRRRRIAAGLPRLAHYQEAYRLFRLKIFSSAERRDTRSASQANFMPPPFAARVVDRHTL